jgi:hypothetical protein
MFKNKKGFGFDKKSGGFYLDISAKNWRIEKIHTKDGYKVGMTRDIPELNDDFKEDTEILDKKLYGDEEARKQLAEWSKKLNLPIFDAFVDEYFSLDYSQEYGE